MSKQNIYDNEAFFQGYKSLRDYKNSANNLYEKPALFSLLPDLTHKKVLDLGCGYGENCLLFAQKGASKVIGLDISSKMLEIAREENSHPRVEYLNMPMEDIPALKEEFDLVVSSLAFHYVENFDELVKNIHKLLKAGGSLVFSQENPLTTCFSSGERWTLDKEGHKLYANISNYSVQGKREQKWLVDGVVKYHRTFSSIINSLVKADFQIKEMIEPAPSEEMLKENPDNHKLLHKPDFLLIKAEKA
ncbi:MAG: class I SAM-dependent methyltransferase [Treponemataceae bacterium]|nr:class I SAM-dependent methyltransferase [Treponemataceae bacterium]